MANIGQEIRFFLRGKKQKKDCLTKGKSWKTIIFRKLRWTVLISCTRDLMFFFLLQLRHSQLDWDSLPLCLSNVIVRYATPLCCQLTPSNRPLVSHLLSPVLSKSEPRLRAAVETISKAKVQQIIATW